MSLGAAVDGDEQLGVARWRSLHFTQVEHPIADLSDAQDSRPDAQLEQDIR